MQDDLIESIRRFSVSDEPLSTATAQTFVDAFAPLSHAQDHKTDQPSTSQNESSSLTKLKQARSAALLTLASRSSSAAVRQDVRSQAAPVDENIAQLLTPVIRSRLADTTPHSLLSALGFFSALFSVLPSEAHDILTADGIIDLVLEAPEACNAVRRVEADGQAQDTRSKRSLSDEELVGLAVAELISSAANSTATRKYLAGQQAVLDWLDIACVSRGSSNTADHKSDAIAVVAGLAEIKVYRAIASEAMQGLTQSASSEPTSQADHVRKIQEASSERKRKDQALYQATQTELLSIKSQSRSLLRQVDAEHRRLVELSCLEALAYLTVQSTFKERVAADRNLLQLLCTGFDITTPKKAEEKQVHDIDSQRFDGALQLGLATILSNITAYPPTLTSEEKQVRRLRNFANAQGTKQDGSQTDDDDDKLETTAKVEQRCSAVLEAKGVEALSALAVAGPPPGSGASTSDGVSWKVNPSKSVRQACEQALLALLTKQDRVMRGKAVQQGALRAALALSAPVLHGLLPSSSSESANSQQSNTSNGLFSRSAGTSAAANVTSDDLAPLQALAKLLISLNPSLLFPSSDGLLSVSSVICSLLLCPMATRLQKFESLLALTNLASLSPDVCLRIAAFTLETADAKATEGINAGKLFRPTSVVAQACEQLLMEEHTMVRRAWIELLVNLLQVQEVFGYFTSAKSPASQTDAATTTESQDRLTLRLRMLLGLCEVDEWAYLHGSGIGIDGDTPESTSDAQGGEPSLATRMACLALLAMVTEVSTAVEALVTLNRLLPILVSTLILDRSEDAERNEWERADLESTKASSTRSRADTEAEAQLNGINLSMRAGYVLLNVLQFLSEPRSKGLQDQRGGFDQEKVQTALQDSLTHHVVQLKQATGPAHVQEARKGLLQVMAECLKLVKSME
ncbi:Armadillo-type fold [Kalmanozyma brasiliensis GHG001]|nr:Armadillo-type fold [Kalmanozyma brasiliensis GHG001]EST06754.2 Armadillo-type fold [Kalmanozyma brasiliensis GHG001]